MGTGDGRLYGRLVPLAERPGVELPGSGLAAPQGTVKLMTSKDRT